MNKRILRTLLACTGFCVTSVAGPACVAGASTGAWKWTDSGTLGRAAACGAHGVRAGVGVCQFKVPNAPVAARVVREVVSVRNTGTRVACFGLSISTSSMAGLQSFCAKPGATGTYQTSGPAKDFRSTSLSVFVTSGSKSKPIAPVSDSHVYPFTVTFSEPSV